MTHDRTRVVVASHFEEDNLRAVREVEGIEVTYRPELTPPPRWPGDILGDSDWERTPGQQEEYLAMLRDAEVLLDFPQRVERDLLDIAPGVRWVQGGMAGAGPVAREFGLLDTDVIVTTASGVFSNPLAEFVLGGMLHHAKRFDGLRKNRLEKKWSEETSDSLEGRTLCIIGTGSIGQEIAKRAKPFGMDIVGVKRTVTDEDPSDYGVDVLYPTDRLEEALSGVDYVAITLPHTPDTEKLVGAREIAALKPGAHISNVGRGAVMDEEALIEALGSGHVGGAALDVFTEEPLPEDSPLWDFDNVIVSPHATDNVPGLTEHKLVGLFVRNLKRYLAGEPLENELDKRLLY